MLKISVFDMSLKVTNILVQTYILGANELTKYFIQHIVSLIVNTGLLFHVLCNTHMADSRFAPSQWETSLQSNAVPHWLGANLESALTHNHILHMVCYHDMSTYVVIESTFFCRARENFKEIWMITSFLWPNGLEVPKHGYQLPDIFKISQWKKVKISYGDNHRYI